MKNLYPVLIAIFVSLVFTVIIFFNRKEKLETVFSENNVTLSVFQIGLFRNYEYAKDMVVTHPEAIIIKNEEFYYVYSAILKEPDMVERLKNYYDEQKINYYVKQIEVNNNEFLNEFYKYETMMSNVGSETMININEKILKLYQQKIVSDTVH